jgi:SAM-dependent methyltransferase
MSVAERERGDALVRELRGRGEPVIVDLGCGFRRRGTIGVDAAREGTAADLVCLLGIDPIPVGENAADEVVCTDFLEHLPKAVYLESQHRFHYPILQLIDEIWRILRPGGIFTSSTPVFPHPELFQDPTHLSAWTLNSMDYFCGAYPVARQVYGVRACFEKVSVVEEGFYLNAKLRKPA